MSEPSSRPVGAGAAVATASVAAVALLLTACAVFMTRVAFFKAGDEGGTWHARLIDMSFVLPPIAALLFAHGAGWWRRGLRVRAALALAAFPIWAIVLRGTDTVIANDFWWLIVGMQFQGIQPFGVAQ